MPFTCRRGGEAPQVSGATLNSPGKRSTDFPDSDEDVVFEEVPCHNLHLAAVLISHCS